MVAVVSAAAICVHKASVKASNRRHLDLTDVRKFIEETSSPRFIARMLGFLFFRQRALEETFSMEALGFW
jgi:hypothetical protein